MTFGYCGSGRLAVALESGRKINGMIGYWVEKMGYWAVGRKMTGKMGCQVVGRKMTRKMRYLVVKRKMTGKMVYKLGGWREKTEMVSYK